MAHEDCVQRDRIVQIEKDIATIETTNKYQSEQLKEVEQALKECTQAINQLCAEISANKASKDTTKYLITIGLTIVTFIIVNFVIGR